MTATSERQHTNRLASETSPYLLQHAHNPVDWYPWGREALERAKGEGRPILLSIGYAACHWCHVMERESFEDEDIARLMNEHFVCIKVDREERPDLDEIYMAATIAMSGSGGWPMTVFLTPEQEPFFAGTYFPPVDLHGRPGFPSVLQRIATLWREQPERLREQAGTLTEHVRRQAVPSGAMTVGQDAIDKAVDRLQAAFDPVHGGFGPAPKFPAPRSLELLLRHQRRGGDAKTLQMVVTTLDRMAAGGIRDHLGGGFARYSTDERWLVPHFEKMLYDNASLARIYAEAYQVTGDANYRRVVQETLDYALREMQSSEGGFYSSTDADSEGVEGKYFVWAPAQVAAELPEDQASAFSAYYDVSPSGNWEGQSILHTPRSAREVAIEIGCSVAELEERLVAARETMRQARAERVAPGLDDKVLTSWNGLMIGALAEASRVLDEPRYLEAATGAARFVLERMSRPDGGLYRSYRAGKARLDGYLEDYAFLCDALIDVVEAAGPAELLERAAVLAERMVTDFRSEQDGAFYTTARDHEALLVRMRDGSEGALPSGHGVAARVLARLSHHRDEPRLRKLAIEAIAADGRLIERAPEAFTGTLRVVDLLLEGPVEVVLVGAAGDERLGALRRELGLHYLPNRIIVHHDPAAPAPGALGALVADKTLVDHQPALYVCRDFACRAPVTKPSAVAEALGVEAKAAGARRERALSAGRIAGAATAEGTARYAARRGSKLGESGYVALGRTGLRSARVGFGGYRVDEANPEHADALERALLGGCNLIDTSTNYTEGDSERLIGRVLGKLLREQALERDEVIVVSKIGYVQGDNLALAKARDEQGDGFAEMVRYTDECWHCIHPSYLEDQLGRSLDRLGLETLDLCLLHNPEYFFADAARRGRQVDELLREQFYERVQVAFSYLEGQVAAGRIGGYGVSSNSAAAPAADREATDPARLLAAAEGAGGQEHHFRVLQLPINLLESSAVLEATVETAAGAPGDDDGQPESLTVLEFARARDIGVLANRPLNAITAGSLTRLAEPPLEPTSAGELEEAVATLAELESHFAVQFVPRLGLEPERRPDQVLRWAKQLGALDGRLDSTDQLAQVAYGRLLPRVGRLLGAVEGSLEGPAEEAFTSWRDQYLAAIDGALRALRAQIHDRVRARVRLLAERIDGQFDEARRSEPFARRALWVLRSTKGLDVVLLGMRSPRYVDDALTVLGWPAMAEAEAEGVYQAVRDVEPASMRVPR